MRSFISNSDTRSIAALIATFLVLLGIWELLLRDRTGVAADFDRPPTTMPADGAERWVVFGNCLVMTGVSPKQLNDELRAFGDETRRSIISIATHEQSPIAFFGYLRAHQLYPDVVIANVSSWTNGTNFEQETALIDKSDPLGLRGNPQKPADAAKEEAPASFQARIEAELSEAATGSSHALSRRNRLIDFTLFIGKLVTSGSLDAAFYQLNMQPWYKVSGRASDGQGHLALDIAYRDDWLDGLERMADRSVFRLGVQRTLTPRYWTMLEEAVADFEAHGTQVFLVRMPEHPKIRTFNEETYKVSERLAQITTRTGAQVLDVSRLGPENGVRLFDAVHPDADAAKVITTELAKLLHAQGKH